MSFSSRRVFGFQSHGRLCTSIDKPSDACTSPRLAPKLPYRGSLRTLRRQDMRIPSPDVSRKVSRHPRGSCFQTKPLKLRPPCPPLFLVSPRPHRARVTEGALSFLISLLHRTNSHVWLTLLDTSIVFTNANPWVSFVSQEYTLSPHSHPPSLFSAFFANPSNLRACMHRVAHAVAKRKPDGGWLQQLLQHGSLPNAMNLTRDQAWSRIVRSIRHILEFDNVQSEELVEEAIQACAREGFTHALFVVLIRFHAMPVLIEDALNDAKGEGRERCLRFVRSLIVAVDAFKQGQGIDPQEHDAHVSPCVPTNPAHFVQHCRDLWDSTQRQISRTHHHGAIGSSSSSTLPPSLHHNAVPSAELRGSDLVASRPRVDDADPSDREVLPGRDEGECARGGLAEHEQPQPEDGT